MIYFKATAADFSETPGGKSADLVHQTSKSQFNKSPRTVREIE